jgi:hypothetical protein
MKYKHHLITFIKHRKSPLNRGVVKEKYFTRKHQQKDSVNTDFGIWPSFDVWT